VMQRDSPALKGGFYLEAYGIAEAIP